MRIHTQASNEVDILQRLVMRASAELTPEAALYLLSWQFGPADLARVDELAEKAQLGELTETEAAEIHSYDRIGNLVAILHAKARAALRT